jgi:hypothetical protein
MEDIQLSETSRWPEQINVLNNGNTDGTDTFPSPDNFVGHFFIQEKTY